MFIMIMKMSAVTALYVVLTVLIWKFTKGRKIGVLAKIVIGLLYGTAAILSTHFGVNYDKMMLNVRDMGPLSAGLFFDPISGIIAGLVGGIERYIAGTYWGVGSYTRIACSVSTCLAGFVAAGMRIFLFKKKKPSATYAFFMGAVMEVFHMYVVFITHRGDMNMAFYVVKTCAPPMITFTGLGMAASSVALKIFSGEWKNPFRRKKEEEISVSQKFRFWLFAVTLTILVLNLVFSLSIQTQTAIQAARETLTVVSGDISQTYDQLQEIQEDTNALAEENTTREAKLIAEMVKIAGGVNKADEEFLDSMRSIFSLNSVTTIDLNGNVIRNVGDEAAYDEHLAQILQSDVESLSFVPNSSQVIAGARCGDGMIQVVGDQHTLASALNLSGFSKAITNFHVGSKGTFDMIPYDGPIAIGTHKGMTVPVEDAKAMEENKEGVCYQAKCFGVDSICRYQHISKKVTLLVTLPMTEVYANRDAQTYESVFAAIILFAVIYVLISMLVQRIVVNNLELVNASLGRITGGNLDEVVSVRNSSEFASLSDDINQTVEVLKGYIDAAEKRIEQELEFARTIQASALPTNFKFPRDDFEIYASMDPAKEVGGDFYDFFFIDQNKLALVIADVSGKGIPAALFMMRAKTAIRGLAESGKSPSAILDRANNTLCEGNDAEMFVTVWIGIIDLTTGKMQCANAGHEYPVVMRDGEDYEYARTKHGLALAAMEDMHYKEYELQLNPGDRLFVYTDGIPEALDANVEQYGPDRLKEVLNTVKDVPMENVLPTVRKHIADFVGEADQFDDITMLGFVYRGTGKG